jgi:hypothetical protein
MLFFAFSCQEDAILNDLSVKSENSLTDFEVKLHNGYLWFKDSSVFEQTLQDVVNLPQEERVAWERGLDFQSLESIYNKALEEDEKMFARLEQLPIDEVETMANIPDFSDFTLQNQHLFKFMVNEEEASYNLKIYNTKVSALLNTSGIVKIGEKIYQYNEDNRKVILDGDDNKIPLLFGTTNTDEDSQVVFQKVDIKNISSNNISNARTYDNQACNHENDGYRVLGNVSFITENPITTGYWEFDPSLPDPKYKWTVITIPGEATIRLEAKTQKKSWGKWRNHTTGYNRISGTMVVYDYYPVFGGSPQLNIITVNFNVNSSGTISTQALQYDAYSRAVNDNSTIDLSAASAVGITFKGKNNTECKANPGGF